MVYTLNDKKDMAVELETLIVSKNYFIGKSFEEIKDEVHRYFEANPSQAYKNKLQTAEDEWKAALPAYQKDPRWFMDNKNKHEANIESLGTGAMNVFDQLLKEKVEPLLKLEDAYRDVKKATQITVSVKKWFSDKAEEIANSTDTMEEAINKEKYVKELRNHYVHKKIGILRGTTPSRIRKTSTSGTQDVLEYLETKIPANIQDEELRKYIFDPHNIDPAIDDDAKKGETLKALSDAIRMIDATALQNTADGDITAKVNLKKGKLAPIKQSYEKLSESLTDDFDFNIDKVNDEFLETSILYGRAKLNGADITSVKGSQAFKKVVGARVKERAKRVTMDYNRVTYTNLEDAFNQIKADAESGAITEKEAVEEFEEIDGYMKAIKADVDLELDELFPSVYKDVLACSKKDNSMRDKKNKYLIIDSEGKMTKDWKEGTHAQTGIGKYLETYGGFTRNVVVQPGLAEKGWTYITSLGRRRAAARIERRRVPEINTKDVLKGIKEKHKRATWRDDKRDYIKISDVADAGLGLALEENDIDEMESAWTAINILDDRSNISDIIAAYSEAARIGSDVNADAKRWTQIIGGEFKEMDNKINKELGISYYGLDKFLTVANTVRTSMGLNAFDVNKLYAEHDLKKTAIKPMKYAPAIATLATAGGALGLLALLHGTATGESPAELTKKHPLYHPFERLTEFTISLLTALGVSAWTKGAAARPSSARPSS